MSATLARPAEGEAEVERLPAGANVLLCADDFAISEGVSRGIEELALARLLSATSAIVTLPTWKEHAGRLARLRGFLAVGLHVNLTLGAPLGEMPALAPDGELPANGVLIRKALLACLDEDEIRAEIERQIEAFETGVGFPPDFIDGHQHVHALPRIRRVLIAELSRRLGETRPLVRDPADSTSAILRRHGPGGFKALAIGGLARGFGEQVRAAGFPTNHGFSGVSAFDLDTSFEDELHRFFRARGRRHLVMCHPGYVDEALSELDDVVERRHQELDALFGMPGLQEAIWHVRGGADRPPVRWQKAIPA